MTETSFLFFSILAFILLLVPFGLLWYFFYSRIKKYIKTSLSYSLLILITFILFLLYAGLCVRIGFYIKGEIGNAILVSYYSVGMTLIWAFWPLFIVTFTFTVLHFIKRRRMKKTNKA